MSRHVALLRGVNVGGRNRLPMKDLAALFEQAGCTDVSTYIQSGNVLFSASAALAKTIPERIATDLHDGLGLETPVVTRTAAQWRRIAEAHPFGPAADPKLVAVVFLAKRPPASLVAGLDPDRSPGDSFEVRGSEVLMHCPAGMARTKLTNAWLDSSLKTVSTVRNWRTVRAITERLG